MRLNDVWHTLATIALILGLTFLASSSVAVFGHAGIIAIFPLFLAALYLGSAINGRWQ